MRLSVSRCNIDDQPRTQTSVSGKCKSVSWVNRLSQQPKAPKSTLLSEGLVLGVIGTSYEVQNYVFERRV